MLWYPNEIAPPEVRPTELHHARQLVVLRGGIDAVVVVVGSSARTPQALKDTAHGDVLLYGRRARKRVA